MKAGIQLAGTDHHYTKIITREVCQFTDKSSYDILVKIVRLKQFQEIKNIHGQIVHNTINNMNLENNFKTQSWSCNSDSFKSERPSRTILHLTLDSYAIF